MEKHGVKELKEALIAAALVGKLAFVLLKDGAQAEDAVALLAKMQDPAFKAKVMAGVQGVEMLDDEIQDLKLPELLEIAQVIPELLVILKG